MIKYVFAFIGLITFLITLMVFIPILNSLIPEMSNIGTAAISLVMIIPVVLIVSAFYTLFTNSSEDQSVQR